MCGWWELGASKLTHSNQLTHSNLLTCLTPSPNNVDELTLTYLRKISIFTEKCNHNYPPLMRINNRETFESTVLSWPSSPTSECKQFCKWWTWWRACRWRSAVGVSHLKRGLPPQYQKFLEWDWLDGRQEIRKWKNKVQVASSCPIQVLDPSHDARYGRTFMTSSFSQMDSFLTRLSPYLCCLCNTHDQLASKYANCDDKNAVSYCSWPLVQSSCCC